VLSLEITTAEKWSTVASGSFCEGRKIAILSGCAWVAAIRFDLPQYAALAFGILRILRLPASPGASLNLRVGGSIPPRLTNCHFATIG